MWWNKNKNRCPDTVPDDLTSSPGPVERTLYNDRGQCVGRVMLESTGRRERRQWQKWDVGPDIVPIDPDDAELREELEDTTLGDEIHAVYRVRRCWWRPGGLADRVRALRWLQASAELL